MSTLDFHSMDVRHEPIGIGNRAHQCVIDGETYTPPDYPHVSTFYESLGGYAFALYATSSISVGILAGEYILLVRYVLKNVPSKRQVATLWVTSIHLVASIMAFFGVVTPMASPFVWTFFKGYVGVILGNFVGITVAWHGGEKKMVDRMDGRDFDMRIRPCCFICCLPNNTPFTRKKLRILKMFVNQIPHVYTWMIFLLLIFTQCGISTIGNTDPSDPYFYINIILIISFVSGMWAIFTLFGIEKKYNMLSINQYRKKALLLKVTIVLINVQDIVIDMLITVDVIKCVDPNISAKAMGTVMKSILVMVETIILGSVVFYFYVADKERKQHIREDSKRFQENIKETQHAVTQNKQDQSKNTTKMDNYQITMM